MKLSRVSVLASVLAVSAALFVTACGSDDDDQWKGETINLGSLFSTTGDGVAFGPQQVKGAELAIAEINEDEGINGAELTLSLRNDASNPAASAREMNSLIRQDGVLAVLGPTFSNSAAEADPVANRLKTPVLAVSNTGPGIVGDCDYPCDFIFRDSLGEATAIPTNITNLIARESPATAAIVFPPDDPFGQSTAGIARKAFREAGVRIVEAKVDGEGIWAGPGQMRTTKTLLADALMITASSGEAAADMISLARSSGFKGTILGGNAFNSTLAAKSAGVTGRGAQSAAAWFAGNASEENQEFIADYQEKYGEAPDQFAAQAYTGVKLLAEAAEDADLGFDDLAADRQALRTSLEKVDEETPLGQFRFTPDHDVIQPIWIVAMDGTGGYQLVERVDP